MTRDNPHIIDEHTALAPRARVPSVRHYYGDRVRELFVGISVLIGFIVPLSGETELGLLFGGPAIIILVLLAGLTNPHGTIVLIFDVAAAAAGVLVAEYLAIFSYAAGSLVIFAVLEVVSALFVTALYFSAKNVRALYMRTIGHIDRIDEFDEL